MEMNVPALVTKEGLIKLVGRVEEDQAKELQERQEELDRAKTYLQSLTGESMENQSTADTSNASKIKTLPEDKKRMLALWPSKATMSNPSKDRVWMDDPNRILNLHAELSVRHD